MNSFYRKRTAELLEAGRPGDHPGRWVDWFLSTLIGLNIIAVILESVSALQIRFHLFFLTFEVASVSIFTLEYILRVWSCPDHSDVTDKDPLTGRLRYMLTPYALIDLIAILPSLLVLFINLVLRFLRVVRLLRLFKFTRYSVTMQALLDSLRAEAGSLAAAFFLMFVLFVLASSGIYLLENKVQPDDFGSIPAAMWWAMTTLTTVGYGDVIPVTPWGKMFGGCITIIGVGMVALPAGIIASGFSDHLQRRRTDYDVLLKRLLDPHASAADKTQVVAELSRQLRLSESTATNMLKIGMSDKLRE
jgi:voltage-gated potassium channel